MSDRVYTLMVRVNDEDAQAMQRFHKRQFTQLAEARRFSEALSLLFPEARCQIVSTGRPLQPIQRVLRG